MVFGVGYFLKYSFEQGWIGPTGRVLAAYAWGLALLAGGQWFRRRTFERYGLWLSGGGIAVLYFASFAASQIYHLFPFSMALAIMVLTTALAVSLAVNHDSAGLAGLGLLGGLLTPILLHMLKQQATILLPYILLLDVGVLTVAFFKRWPGLTKLAFVGSWLLYAAWRAMGPLYGNPAVVGEHYYWSTFWMAFWFVSALFLVFTLIPCINDIRGMANERLKGAFIPLPNALTAFLYSYFMIERHFPRQWTTAVALGYAAVAMAMAAILYRRRLTSLPSYTVMLILASVFTAISPYLLLSGPWIAVSWAALAVGLAWTSRKLEHRPLGVVAVLVLIAAASRFMLHDYFLVYGLAKGFQHFTLPYATFLPQRLASIVAVLAALHAFSRMAKGRNGSFLMNPSSIIVIQSVTAIFVFAITSIEVSAAAHEYLPDARMACISILWALYAIGLVAYGIVRGSKDARSAGMILFAITLVKVFSVDMAQFSTPWRIMSFLVVGMILLGTSYLYYRHKDRIGEDATSGPDVGRDEP